MMKFNEGDHVRVTPKAGGNVVIEGKVSNLPNQASSNIVDVRIDGDRQVYGGRPFSLEYWNAELIEPAYMLPTEPGRYLDKDGESWELTDDGRWTYAGEESDWMHPEDYLPLERIYTLSEAAEVVASWVEDREVEGIDIFEWMAEWIRRQFRDA
jgi:hypothetical protein